MRSSLRTGAAASELPAARPRLGDSVPVPARFAGRASVLTPAARKAVRQRMLFLRKAAVERLVRLTGSPEATIQGFHRALRESSLPDTLLQRGAGPAFAHELPQGGLLYLLVRAARPRRVVETGVGPGYSTAWILAGLDANGAGELVSLGPGSAGGRSPTVGNVSLGQFVPPGLRSRWTLAIGNTEDRLREILAPSHEIDLFFYDNGPVATRARFELKSAWEALSDRGILLAHRIDASPAWAEFCRLQGMPPQVLDPGPPPLGALSVARPAA